MTRYRSSLLVILLLATFMGPAAADPTIIRKAEDLLRAGKPAEAFALLEPLEIKLAGDPIFDYRLATAALYAGNPSRASFIYERILAAYPEYHQVRADMGNAYYQMGDLARAKIEYDSILSLSNLPPDLRSQVESQRSVVDQRQSGEKRAIVAYYQIGFGRDTNPLAQTSNQIVSLANGASQNLTATDIARTSNGWGYRMGVELLEKLDSDLDAYVGGDLSGRVVRHFDTADYQDLNARAGLQYRQGNQLWRGGLGAGRYRLNDRSTRDATQANLDWQYTLDTNLFTLKGLGAAYRYIPGASKSEDYNLYSLTAGWTRALGTATIGVLEFTVGKEFETGGREDGDKKLWGPRATLNHQLTESLALNFTAGKQWGHYTDHNVTYGLDRKDTLSDATVSLIHNLPDRWSVKALYAYTKNESNADLYTYNRREYGLVLRKDF